MFSLTFIFAPGESHYVGPIVDGALGALQSAPFNFVEDMPHDAWRTFLPTAIDLYVKNTTIVTNEGIVFWYRRNLGSAFFKSFLMVPHVYP